MKKALSNIFNALFGGIMGFIAFLLFTSVITLIVSQAIKNATVLTVLDFLLITPGSLILSAIVSKRICNEAYVYYGIVSIMSLGGLILAVRNHDNMDSIPSLALSAALCLFFYYRDAIAELKAKKEEAAKRAARIEAGLPPTEEEEEELRRQAELEAATHPVYDPETWDETLYNENEPDMWDDPVEDEEEFLHEEYHGAYENMPEEEGSPEEEEEEEMTEEEARVAARRSGRRSRSH